MTYFVLRRGGEKLYAMNITLSEEEARRYGSEGETVPVTAVIVWTELEKILLFRDFLSITQDEASSPFGELVRDMRSRRVDVLALSAGQLRERLRHYKRQGFVALEPGPEQKVLKIDEFLEDLAD